MGRPSIHLTIAKVRESSGKICMVHKKMNEKSLNLNLDYPLMIKFHTNMREMMGLNCLDMYLDY